MFKFTSILSTYAAGKRKTLKYEFAMGAFAVWVAYTIRLGLANDAAWITAQSVVYGPLTSTVFLYITGVVGIQTWQNIQDASPAKSSQTIVEGETP